MQSSSESNPLIVFSAFKLASESHIAFDKILASMGINQFIFLPPHITFLSPCSVIVKDDLVDVVQECVKNFNAIDFCLRTLMIMSPLFQHKKWYLFLVPDQGFADLTRLYRQLHQDKLRVAYDPTFPFIPHVTLASFAQRDDCIDLFNAIYHEDIEIKGRVETISIAEIINDKPNLIAEIELGQ